MAYSNLKLNKGVVDRYHRINKHQLVEERQQIEGNRRRNYDGGYSYISSMNLFIKKSFKNSYMMMNAVNGLTYSLFLTNV